MTVDAERELRTQEEADESVNESDNSREEDECDLGVKGVAFCLTGHMSAKRADIVKAIVHAGGKVVSSITKEVQVLVVGGDDEANSTKRQKAADLGITIVNEDYLKKHLDY